MTALARLSFWVAAERMDELEGFYAKALVPILNKHGLVEGQKPDRVGVVGVFSRLFALDSAAEIIEREQALHADPAWQEVLEQIGKVLAAPLETAHAEGMEFDDPHSTAAAELGETAPLLRYAFGVYAAPAGAGTGVEAGPGFRQGAWQSFGVLDGLPDAPIKAIVEDGAGHLWFAAKSAGVCRYDGVEFLTFIEEDGLGSKRVWSMLEDRAGHMWFGTSGRGVSRYDGTHFVTFTNADGLA